jgi:hypothetical protein
MIMIRVKDPQKDMIYWVVVSPFLWDWSLYVAQFGLELTINFPSAGILAPHQHTWLNVFVLEKIILMFLT